MRFEETARNGFAAASATIFLNYLIKHYFPDLPNTYCKPVNIELFESEEVTIYPVPFDEVLSIRSPIPADIKIYNLSGEIVYSGSIGNEEKINLHRLKEGVYFIILSSEGRLLFRGKIIKKGGASAPPEFLLQAFCKGRSSFEFNNFLGGNVQFGAGTRVANNSCTSFFNFESTH